MLLGGGVWVSGIYVCVGGAGGCRVRGEGEGGRWWRVGVVGSGVVVFKHVCIVFSAVYVWWTLEEMGRKHRGMDRPGFWQVPEGSGEQGNWRTLVTKSFVGSQRPMRVKGLMVMMMILMVMCGSVWWCIVGLCMW